LRIIKPLTVKIMARARNIKPALFKNELLGQADPLLTILFTSLWCLADREGRLEDRPLRIKAETFPYRDGIDMNGMLAFLEENEFIERYEVAGQKYIQITKFAQHQTPHHMEVGSVIPPPANVTNKYNYAPISVPLRRSIYARDNHQCVICHSKERLSIDHIIPISKGGDSSPENLRTLCLSCNSSRQNNDDISSKRKARIEQSMSTSCPHDEKAALHPTDLLIPDSLIPDSGFTDFTDSLVPPFCAGATPPDAAGTDLVVVAKPKTKKDPAPKAEPAPTNRIWFHYAEAYERRYSVQPVRNGKVNGQLANLLQRLGADEAPLVAAWFVSHNLRYYVQKMHSVDCLLADAEKLRTEWATNTRVTATMAQQADRTQTNFEAFAGLIAAAEAREQANG
jgi:hypothetical protein